MRLNLFSGFNIIKLRKKLINSFCYISLNFDDKPQFRPVETYMYPAENESTSFESYAYYFKFNFALIYKVACKNLQFNF